MTGFDMPMTRRVMAPSLVISSRLLALRKFLPATFSSVE